ncbi:hypothetical protein Vadar_022343 [Vaccinium darrowii]|uniref:Uncharacterized protein n=1 Tax=Vaccinium darrowii TaxID=229202 RepID=A0ACB7Y0X2_9ERIC|nr:hypothetical protein Vadar_022343 [Vaccinium darrowii]
MASQRNQRVEDPSVVTLEIYATLQRQMEVLTKTLQETQRAKDNKRSQNQDNERQERRMQEHPENEDYPLDLMKAQIESLAKQVRGKAPTTVEELVHNTDSPFTLEIMREPLLRKFKMSHLDAFSMTTDTLDHLETYKNLMMLQAVPDEIMCRAFPVTLKGSARMTKVQQTVDLPILHQASLRDYTARFTKESMQVEANGRSSFNCSLHSRVNSGQLLFSLTKDLPITVVELMMRVQKHMNAKDALSARRSRDDNNDFTPGQNEKWKREQTGLSKDVRIRRPDQRSSTKKGGPLEKYQQYIPLVATAEQILDDLHDDLDLKWLGKLRYDPNKRSKDKWCRGLNGYTILFLIPTTRNRMRADTADEVKSLWILRKGHHTQRQDLTSDFNRARREFNNLYG